VGERRWFVVGERREKKGGVKRSPTLSQRDNLFSQTQAALSAWRKCFPVRMRAHTHAERSRQNWGGRRGKRQFCLPPAPAPQRHRVASRRKKGPRVSPCFVIFVSRWWSRIGLFPRQGSSGVICVRRRVISSERESPEHDKKVCSVTHIQFLGVARNAATKRCAAEGDWFRARARLLGTRLKVCSV